MLCVIHQSLGVHRSDSLDPDEGPFCSSWWRELLEVQAVDYVWDLVGSELVSAVTVPSKVDNSDSVVVLVGEGVVVLSLF